MSRWDATLTWGPDERLLRDKDDDELTAAIAAAIRDLADHRLTLAELATAAAWLSKPAPVVPVPTSR